MKIHNLRGPEGGATTDSDTQPLWESQRIDAETRRLKKCLRILEQLHNENSGAIVHTPLLNQGERHIFKIAVKWCRNNGLRVSPQVSMGEFLKCAPDPSDTVLWSYNARRVDFLVCDWQWAPVFGIEHHGSGHTMDKHFAQRDEIKLKALTIAKIGLAVTTHKDTEADILAALDAALHSARRHREPALQPAKSGKRPQQRRPN
jgi:hypothetical protein